MKFNVFLTTCLMILLAPSAHAASLSDLLNATSIICSSSIGQIEILRQDANSWSYARNTSTEIGNPPKVLVHMLLNSSAGNNFEGIDTTYAATTNLSMARDYRDSLGNLHHRQSVLTIESDAAIDDGRKIDLEFGNENRDIEMYMTTFENNIQNCRIQ